MKKNVIKDLKTQKHYWDNGIVRNFEEVVAYSITWKEAIAKFPECIKM
jgi:hypothetical protein|tara:strand:- start:51 stop:194 length:144 start_codon:yes stop_codon:yes gene_type:complete